MEDNTNSNGGGAGGDNQQNNQQNNSSNADIDKIGSDAVNKLLSSYGFENVEDLKKMVDKVKEEEQARMSDSEKKDANIEALTKKLAESEKGRLFSESKLAAIKLGAKPELVDDLVAVAMSRATKDKDVSAVISEIKEGDTGAVYFNKESDNSQQQNNLGATRGKPGVNKNNSQQQNNSGGKNPGVDFVNSFVKSMGDTKEKKRYFKS